MNWLVRAARWVRNPPSEGRVKLVVAVIVLAIAIVTAEHFGWWPDWATQERVRPQRPMR